MKLLEILDDEMKANRSPLLAMAVCSGIADAAILAIINAAPQISASGKDHGNRLLLLFIIVVAAYILGLYSVLTKISHLFERMVLNLRLRLLRKAVSAELSTLREIGSSQIYNRIAQEAPMLSQAAWQIAACLEAVVMIACCMLYLAWLSIPAFLVAISLIGAGALSYAMTNKRAEALIERTTDTEVSLLSSVTELLDGFKELKLNGKKRAEFMEDTEGLCEEVRGLKVSTADIFNRNHIFAQSFSYLIIAVLVFVLPLFMPTYSDVLVAATTTILFIIGSIGLVINTVPILGKANIAAEHMLSLEAELDRHLGESHEEHAPAPPMPERFQKITLKSLEYVHPGAEGFKLGPVDFTLEAGTVTFLVGGNGSGKSTLVEVLTGLQHPTGGWIRVDDRTVTDGNRGAYREYFGLIDSSFHLFKRLYGLDVIDEEGVKVLLRQLKLHDKTWLVGKEFTTLDLSSGQRRRLAMIVALLENRPFYVFDEWTADQDVEFRRYFYQVLLPDLKAKGHTVLVVSHDDRFFGAADRVITLDKGSVISDVPRPSQTATGEA